MEIAASSFAVDDGRKGRLQDLARHILDERNRRQKYFPQVLFDEAPWQMLLILYASETSRLSSDSLRRSVREQPATGNRWIDYLSAEGLVTRRTEPSDESRSMVELAPKGVGLLELYLRERLERGELRAGQQGEPAHSRRSEMPIAIAVLVTAALSGGITYLAMSFGALAGAFAGN